MEIFFLKLLMWIQIGISKLVDNIFELFNVFAGISNVDTPEGKDQNLLIYFLTNNTVLTVFWSMLVIGVFLATIFTVVGVVKNMATCKKSMGAVVGKFGLSVVSMVVIVMIIFMGIFGVNLVLAEINVAFTSENELSVGQQLFLAAVPDDAWEIDDVTNERYDRNAIVNKETWDKLTPDIVFGVRKKAWMFEDASEKFYKDKETGIVKTAIIDINGYNYFISLPAVIIMGIVIFMAIMGLVVRLYDLVFMFLTSPLIMATLPLDDGAKFKLWRETIISKALLAYGTVFAVNIYTMLLPKLVLITIPTATNTVNSIFHMFLIICGALTISAGQLLFSRIMGTSAEESRQQSHGLRSLFMGAAGTAAAVGVAGKMVFGGGKLAYKGGRGVMNTGAKIFTGGYKGGKLSAGIKEDIKGVASKMSNKVTEKGGLIGAARTRHNMSHPIEPPAFAMPYPAPATHKPATAAANANGVDSAKPTTNNTGG